MPEGYIDITKEMLENSNPNCHKVLARDYFEYDGIKYKVDKKNVVLDYSKDEIEVAKWLGNTFGGEIWMNPRINNPQNIQTSDYFWNNEKWDLKSIKGSGKRIIEDSIKNKQKQANNFIFDITNSKISDKDLIRQLQKVYNSKTTNFVDKIIVKKNNDVMVIYKRK